MNLRQPFLILSVILIIGIASVSIYTYYQSSEISTLTEQKTDLETSKTDLMGQVVQFQADLNEISGSIMSLETQITDLENENLEINNDLDEKKTENQQLINDISSREESINALEEELTDSKNQLSVLNEQITQLLSQIENLAVPIDQRHLDPLIMATQNCAECHTQVAEQAFAGESNSYHNTHLNNNLLNFNCADCHKSVDILSESEDLSRLIDDTICIKCHTTFPDKNWMEYTDNAEKFAQQFSNCVVCHEDWETDMEDATFVNLNVITNSDCRTCHLDNALFVVEKSPITIECAKCH